MPRIAILYPESLETLNLCLTIGAFIDEERCWAFEVRSRGFEVRLSGCEVRSWPFEVRLSRREVRSQPVEVRLSIFLLE